MEPSTLHHVFEKCTLIAFSRAIKLYIYVVFLYKICLFDFSVIVKVSVHCYFGNYSAKLASVLLKYHTNNIRAVVNNTCRLLIILLYIYLFDVAKPPWYIKCLTIVILFVFAICDPQTIYRSLTFARTM